MPTRGMVTTQEPKMVAKRLQFTPVAPFIRPTAIVAPVMHCVVEMGRPMRAASSTMMAAPNSMQKQREGEWYVRLLPRERSRL